MGTIVQTPTGFVHIPSIGDKILNAITLDRDSDDPLVALVAVCIAMVVIVAIGYGLYSMGWLITSAPGRSWLALLGIIQYVGTLLTGLAVGIGWTAMHDFT